MGYQNTIIFHIFLRQSLGTVSLVSALKLGGRDAQFEKKKNSNSGAKNRKMFTPKIAFYCRRNAVNLA